MTLRILSIILTITTSSCSYSDKDFNLNEVERSFLHAFKKGDTLCYQNPMKRIEKFLVIGLDSIEKKESGTLMALPAYKEVYIKIKHLPIDTFPTISKDKKEKQLDTIPEHLICITKHPQKKETAYSFQFQRFFSYRTDGLGTVYPDTVINGLKLTNYYTIKEIFADNDTDYEKIEMLFWSQAEGLLAYKQRNGIYWTKQSSR